MGIVEVDIVQIEAIELLLSAGAPINAAAKFGATALHLAAKHGMAEAAKVLLAHGADVHAANSKGAAPLHLAARHGHTEAAAGVRSAFSPNPPAAPKEGARLEVRPPSPRLEAVAVEGS